MTDHQQLDDSQLINKSKDGDIQAYGELYTRHAPAIFRFLFAHLDDRQDAEDLTEDVFIRTWQSISKYREEGIPFAAYLYRVARNALNDHYRQKGRSRSKVSLDAIGHIPDHNLSPAEAMSANVDQQELFGILGQLKEDFRLVLVLRFLNQLTPEETALVMGRSVGSIRVLQHRALAALRKILEE